jgi:uncharacterized protein YbbK (DUF523 family)
MTLHELYARLHGDDRDAADAAARTLASEGKQVVVVSACLLGERTRYDGGDKLTPAVVDPLAADAGVTILPLCPEILGGMGCPRRPVELERDAPDARVIDDTGADRTAELIAGADRADALSRLAGARRAILKERSPSCGVHRIHAGGHVVPGQGAFAARLTRHLPVVESDEDVIKDP